MTTPPGYGGEQGLPDHDTEIMSAHGGAPSVEKQARTHGAGIPAVDNGMTEAAKYGTSSPVC